VKFWRTCTGVYAGASDFASVFGYDMMRGTADGVWFDLLVGMPYMIWVPGGGGIAPHGAFEDIAVDIC
jgi:hypothetical protein